MMSMNNLNKVSRNLYHIYFQGSLLESGVHSLVYQIYQATEKAGFKEVILDFEECTSAFAEQMLAICAQVMDLRARNFDFKYIPPKDKVLEKLFSNANWAYYLDPRHYDPSSFKIRKQLPATQFRNPKEQNEVVNKIVETILSAIPDIERKDLAALEWSIGELTDNVLVHSESKMGGLIQVSTFEKRKKAINFVISDYGRGIPNSLREGYPTITDIDALDKAIREGVTRDPKIGQGNGLYGSYQICSKSSGMFEIISGHGVLLYDKKYGLHVKNSNIPFSGTLVQAEIDFSIPHLLENALKFNNNKYEPTDYVELRYESQDKILIKDEAYSFLSRLDGTPIRIKLLNLARMLGGQQIFIDFSGVALVSSSFADEVVGKCFQELGPMEFMNKFKLINMSTNVKDLIDKAIYQRMKSI